MCVHYLLANGASTKGKNVFPFRIKSLRHFSRSIFSYNLTPLLAAVAKGNRMPVYALLNVHADLTAQDDVFPFYTEWVDCFTLGSTQSESRYC
jgi:hypothetical protein